MKLVINILGIYFQNAYKLHPVMQYHQADYLTFPLTVCLCPVVMLLPTTPLLQLDLTGDINAGCLGRRRGWSPGCSPRVIPFPGKHSQGSREGVRLVGWMAVGCVFGLLSW